MYNISVHGDNQSGMTFMAMYCLSSFFAVHYLYIYIYMYVYIVARLQRISDLGCRLCRLLVAMHACEEFFITR